MKAVAEQTGKVGSRSEKTETLGEKSETKKKVRVVKKIVKKKIIKKVLKRVPVAPKSNDLEKDASLIPNDNSSVEIEKPNPVIHDVIQLENVKDTEVIHDVKDFENVMEPEVSDMEDYVHLFKSSDELQDSNQKQIELQDGVHNQIELQDCYQNQSDHNQIELQDCHQNQIELQDSDDNHIELQYTDPNQIALFGSSENQIDFKHCDQNQIEEMDIEHDTNTNNVEDEGGEGVKELVVNDETGGLKPQEALAENQVPSGETVASRSHIKQAAKIFIHGLPEETKEEDIRKAFEHASKAVEVKLITDPKTGKNRGFGFIIFASTVLAKMALPNVDICGRPCNTSAIDGNYSVILTNIDREWKIESVVEFLEKIGIEKIDGVLILHEPANAELNCGFAFIEFETEKDAQIAYRKLQKKNVIGMHSNIQASWALSSVDPVEEEIQHIKSVYAENIPLFWDEKEVEDHFKMFGEIESIALSKNLRTAKRNDYAFINYKTFEAARLCIEAVTSKKSTTHTNLKSQLKVSLAKSMPKVKPVKPISDSAVTKLSKVNQKANQPIQSQNQYQNTYRSKHNLSALGVYKPPQKPKITIGKREDFRRDLGASTTDELVQLLREQASWKHSRPSSTAGMNTSHHQPPSGGNQRFNEPGSKPLYHHDSRVYHQTHLQIPNATPRSPRANMASFPRYDQHRPQYTSGMGSHNVVIPDPRHFQIRDQTTYPGSGSGSNSMYRRQML